MLCAHADAGVLYSASWGRTVRAWRAEVPEGARAKRKGGGEGEREREAGEKEKEGGEKGIRRRCSVLVWAGTERERERAEKGREREGERKGREERSSCACISVEGHPVRTRSGARSAFARLLSD